MRLVELKEDDERFGHKAGDLFLVEDADYDDEKVVGVKIKLENIDNSFYKTQVRKKSFTHLADVGLKTMETET